MRKYGEIVRAFEKAEGGLYNRVKSNDEAIKLRHLGQVERLWGSVLRKRGKGITHTEIKMVSGEGGGKSVISTGTMAYNRMSHYLPVNENGVVMTGDIAITAPNYSKGIISLSVDAGTIGYLRMPFYLTKKGEWLTINGYGEIVSVTNNLKKLEDQEAAKAEVKESLIYNDIHAPNYAGVSATAGQKKQYMMYLLCQNLPGFDPKISMYETTYGFSELCGLKTGEVSQKELAQTSNRRSQFLAPNTPGIELGTFGVFMGKFDDDRRDGFGFVDSRFVARFFESITDGKFAVSDEACEGLLVQCRPYLCKLMAETVNQEYIKKFINRRHLETVYINIEEMRHDEELFEKTEREIARAMNKDKESSYWGKLVVFCDNESDLSRLDFITDLNGDKAPHDIRMKSTLNVLSLSHNIKTLENGANLSTQLVTSLLLENSEKSCELINSSFKKLVESKKERLDSEEAGHIHADELDGALSQLLVKMVPTVATRWYAPLLKSGVKVSIEGMLNDIGRLHIPTEGCYQKIISDPGMDFGKHFLKVDIDGKGTAEVLAPAIEKSGRECGIAVKYPKQHFREYLKFKVVTIEEYVLRVQNSDLNNEDKLLLIDRVRHLSTGGLTVPGYELLKNMLAGMDFDGDSLIAFTDPGIFKILENQRPLAVVMDENDPAAR